MSTETRRWNVASEAVDWRALYERERERADRWRNHAEWGMAMMSALLTGANRKMFPRSMIATLNEIREVLDEMERQVANEDEPEPAEENGLKDVARAIEKSAKPAVAVTAGEQP